MLSHEFELKPSQVYLIFSSIVLLMSIGIAATLPILMGLRLVLSFLIVVYGLHMVWRYGLLRSAQSIVCIERTREGEWLLHTPHHTYTARLCDFSTVTSLVSVLRFYAAKERWPKTCVIFRDSLAPDRYRQLVVVLRMS